MKGPAITQENLVNQQGVVKNEVRVNVLNQPYGGFPWLSMPQVANRNWHNAHNFYGDLADLDAATAWAHGSSKGAAESSVTAATSWDGWAVPARRSRGSATAWNGLLRLNRSSARLGCKWSLVQIQSPRPSEGPGVPAVFRLAPGPSSWAVCRRRKWYRVR
jgi:hypothetical protein